MCISLDLEDGTACGAIIIIYVQYYLNCVSNTISYMHNSL